jgi:hypothetical protein
MHLQTRGPEQHEGIYQCQHCTRRFGVLYTPVVEEDVWMAPLRCPHCRRTQVVAFSPAARHLTVHAWVP